MIYLIVNKEQETCKIGYSNNPTKRLQTLQISNSSELTLVSQLQGDIEDEKSLHDIFSSYKIRGEWFTYSDSIKDFFKVEDSVLLNKNICSIVKHFRGIDLQFLLLSLKYIKSKSNQIDLSGRNRIVIAEQFNLSVNNINNSISRLTKYNVIKKVEGKYYVNPTFVIKE